MYIYEIESSMDLDILIDSLKEELNLKEGKITYWPHESVEVEKILSIDKLKEKALEVCFRDYFLLLSFPNIEIEVDENDSKIIIRSKIKLTLKGIDVDRITCDGVPLVKLNLDNLKSEDILDR